MNEPKRPAAVPEPAAGDEQRVRELLRAAGPRPPLSREDLAPIEAAARAAWQAAAAAEDQRRSAARARGWLALASGVALVLVLGWWWKAQAPPGGLPELVASVERVTAEVWAGDGRGSRGVVETGARLAAGTLLETGDGDGEAAPRLALRLEDGASLRLDSASAVRLLSSRRLELRRGALYYDSEAATGAASHVEIVTEFGTVHDVGTRFEVRLGGERDGVRVRVREGKVALEAAGLSHAAAGGEELRLGPDGSLARAAVEPFGAAWAWVVAVAPEFEIEGRLLPDYLDWIGRETGWQVRYESPELATAAVAIVLHGTIAELTPEESLAVVLPGSGLASRLEGGALWIGRPAQKSTATPTDGRIPVQLSGLGVIVPVSSSTS